MDLRLFPSSQHLKPPPRGRETDRNGSPGRPPDDEVSSDKNSRSPFRRRQTSKEPPPPPPPKPQFVQHEKPELQRQENVPVAIPRHGPPPPSVGAATWTHIPRPLSDIRETTEPSLCDLARSQSDGQSKRQSNTEIRRHGSHGAASRHSPKETLHRTTSQNSRQQTPQELLGAVPPRTSPNHKVHNQGDAESIFGIPTDNVPKRASSRDSSKKKKGDSRSRRPGTRRVPTLLERSLTEPKRVDFRERHEEVLKRAGSLNSGSRLCKTTISPPSFTVEDLLDFPNYKHPRIKLDLLVGAPLFVGGGNVEGSVRVMPIDTERRRTQIAMLESVSVDLVGVEELSGARRSVFLSLSTELEHPGQHSNTPLKRPESPTPLSLTSYSMPFSITLPLDVGPPPFRSKHAKIRYVLAVTVWVQGIERSTSVRSSQEIQVLSVYDPEKALMSLPSPLTATDTFSMRRTTGLENITVEAGLHRQVWVSGTSVFVDVSVDNNSRKPVKKVGLQLERAVLCYKHAAASTSEKSAGQARIFDSNERIVLSKSYFKHGTNGWNEFAAFTTNARTFELALPRGHATVRCGKYFEVRFFLTVIACFGHTKSVSVQLPIILIHMNSLDVVPGSVARVAAAIEEKKGGHEPHALDDYQERHLGPSLDPNCDGASSHDPSRTQSVQGRAFSAPRIKSLERLRSRQGEWDELGRVLEKSPRKQAPYIRRNNSTGSTSKNSKGSPKRTARPLGQATIFQVGSDTAEVLLSRRRAAQEKPLPQPPLSRQATRQPSLDGVLDTSDRSPISNPSNAPHPAKPPSNKSSSTSSTPRFLRRLASFGSIHYRTPPSNRKARAFAKEDADRLRSCLQHKPSCESAGALACGTEPGAMEYQARRPAPPTPMGPERRKKAGSRRGKKGIGRDSGEGEKERGEVGLDGADLEEDESTKKDTSQAPERHGIRNFKDRLEASGFEVRWLKFRGKGREERDDERRKREKQMEMERLGWI
ncbi:hypothetical protein EV356DRAFT_535589 [Viridothelium virens]|uniref:Arrestin C-terminal-like domain-containing protein n=1 Tax=Viridothelium virens TaxID=1048519 RepID=A0A6A6GZR2_VIRVR|nr:hypothetical protein EV356DRAFT_535589 [Viridothelium virens]